MNPVIKIASEPKFREINILAYGWTVALNDIQPIKEPLAQWAEYAGEMI